MPWVLLGDFNEILFSHEKEDGRQRPQSFMQAFRDALMDCELEDLNYSGEPYTWKRGKIKERLGRVVANGEWITMHPRAILHHLDYVRSGHHPILLDTDFQAASVIPHGPKCFEAKWLKEDAFRQEVERAWEAAGHATSDGVLAKLNHMHLAFQDWDGRVLKRLKQRLRKAQR